MGCSATLVTMRLSTARAVVVLAAEPVLKQARRRVVPAEPVTAARKTRTEYRQPLVNAHLRRLVLSVAVFASACSRVSEVLTTIPSDAAVDAAPDAGDPALFTLSKLDAGTTHSCASLRGALYCWGDNESGQLGLGDDVDQNQPTRVGARVDWEEVTTGANHSCARRADGALFCFGANEIGQLGNATGLASLEPAEVTLPTGVSHVVTEINHTCAISNDAALWCWGENLEGQLGQADIAPKISSFGPIAVGTSHDWIAVDTGQGDTCGLRAGGDLYCWGRNTGFQLGLGEGAPIQTRVVTRSGDASYRRVQTGQDYSCGIRLDGALACWGLNAFANLGTGDRSQTKVAIQIGDKQDWTELSVDTFHSCAIDSARHLFCWGRNAEGQLGTGDTDDRLSPTQVEGEDFAQIAVGRFHTCALKVDESVWCTGANDQGQLGTGDGDRRSTFTELTFPP